MGIIINEMKSILEEQIHLHDVVVWFDPEHAYGSVIDGLSLPGVSIRRFDPQKGFLHLRREIEPLWSGPQAMGGVRPKLLIYVPVASAESQNALIEYIVSGVHLEPPGANSSDYNTRLALVARRAMEKTLPPASVNKIVEDIEQGRLSLEEAEEIIEKMIGELTGALKLIFKTSNPEEIALQFLTDPTLDVELDKRSASDALIELLVSTFGLKYSTSSDLPSLRADLGRHLLLVEFLCSIADNVPQALKTIPLPESAAARESVVRLVRTWRLRRDLAEAYTKAAENLESELGVGGQNWSLEALRGSETFHRCELALQALVENQLANKANIDLVTLAQQRESSFWSIQEPAIKLRWQIVAQAGRLLLLSEQVLHALKANLPAHKLFERYTSSDAPWCELDTLHRHLDRDYNYFDVDAHNHDSLIKLVAQAQGGYVEAVQELALRFVKSFESIGFVLPGVIQQARVYVDFVQPRIQKGKTAYLLVDSFRFEMARELCNQLPADWQSSLAPALATPPTITEVGMAALMPGAEKGVSLVPAGSGKLGLKVDGSTLKNRQDRIQHLTARSTVPVASASLSDIAPLKDKHLRNKLSNAQLILITASEEIDGLWENHPAMARQLQDHALDQLRRGIHYLLGMGVQTVVISADHGFLAGGGLVLGEPVDAPGGDTADLHRRVWVGKGGSAIQNCLRKPVSAFGLGGDLEIVAPYSLAIFKAPGGSTEYFHGGLSLQELVIPILTITSGPGSVDTSKPPYRWDVALGSKKISTRFFSITVKGFAENLLAQPPRLRVELRAGDQLISQPVSASYGYSESTHDVKMEFEEDQPGNLKPNTITLMVTEIPSVSKVNLHLLDEIGATLLEMGDISIDIAI